MTVPGWVQIGTLITLALAPILVYANERRKTSGSRDSRLWDEGDKLRNFYAAETKGLRAELIELRKASDDLREEVFGLRQDHAVCVTDLTKMHRELARLKRRQTRTVTST